MLRPVLRTVSGRRCLWLAVVSAAALLLAAAPAQAAPFVYVTNLFDDNVSQYDMGAGGLLAPLSPPTVASGQHPAGLTVSPNGKSLYVTNAGPFEGDAAAPPSTGDSVSQYNIRASGGLSPKRPRRVAAGDSPVAVAVRPDNKSAYVVNEFGDSVSQYHIGSPHGRLFPKRPHTVATGFEPTDVTVSPDGKSVYVTNAGGAGTVSQYSVRRGGRLTPKNPSMVDAGDIPVDVTVTPDGTSVYVVDHGVISGTANSASVLQFDVGPGGKLSPKSPPKVAAGTKPISVAVSPNGKSAYVTDDGSSFGNGRDNVFQYDIGPGGKLSPKSPPRVAPGKYPFGIAVSPNGRSVYVVNLGNSARRGTVSQYRADRHGKLQPLTPSKVAAGQSPEWIAVSPVPTAKRQCTHGGWRRFGFKSERRCIHCVEREARR
jgi:DNA-binding beta-propeller fold protein YncE